MKTVVRASALVAVALVLLFASGNAHAELKLAAVFGDNMVLQVDREIAFFGTADPGERVSVTLKNDIIASTKANADGRWLIRMNPLRPGAPFSVAVETEQDRIVLKNVVIGEVWICSGQSNMEWPVRASGNPAEEIANADYPMIRHVNITNRYSPQLQTECTSSGWQVCSPETAADFTAVGYYFARKLHKETGLPVGLINSTWGGTIVEAWTSGKSLKTHPDFKERVEQIEANQDDLAVLNEKYRAELAAWSVKYNQALNTKSEDWEKPETDATASWATLKPGQPWESQNQKRRDGVAWYRKKVEIPESMRNQELKLSVGMIDDIDTTWVNGRLVGRTTGHLKRRQYTVPAEVNQGDSLTIAIRVVDTGGAGGLVGKASDYYIATSDNRIALDDEWKFRFSESTLRLPPRPKAPGFNGPNNPTALYNAMIHPILATSFRGVIWYQGESNAGRPRQYRTLFPLLIQDWRERHSELRGEIRRYEFPFYWVQLANFMKAAEQPGPSNWALLREAQSMTLNVDNTGQAVIIDIGEARDIHPKNKQDVGRRLALLALHNVHQQDVVCNSPTYTKVEVRGKEIRVEFADADGLKSVGGPLKRFEIAGADKKFVWADARIEGNAVIVSNATVTEPKFVRYAWADNPDGCNLYNGAGLPASPFRTDDD